MQQKIRKIYSIKEYSNLDILYHSLTPALGFFLSVFAGWEMILFGFLLGLSISLLILDIDNCYEVITCKFNSTFGRITLRQKNVFSQGVIEVPLNDIENVLIKSHTSSFITKRRFGREIQIDSQSYWIVIVLYSGEHLRLTYYETSLFRSKQKMIDYILFLKENI